MPGPASRPRAALGALLFVACASRASATSSGDISICDAHGNYGCKKPGSKLGGKCEDGASKQGHMEWVKAPVRTAYYTVRAGDARVADDATSYEPEKLTSIHVRVTKSDWKYRGLLLHAVAANGTTVGSWPTSSSLFWSPPVDSGTNPCSQAVLHTDADPKPYGVQFRFKAPRAGTGECAALARSKRT